MHYKRTVNHIQLFFFAAVVLLQLGFLAPHVTAQNKTPEEVKDSARIANHSPQLASIFSLVVPGLGQAYNEKYWKIPIIYGGLVFCAYQFKTNRSNYKIFTEGMDHYIDSDPLTNSWMTLPNVDTSSFVEEQIQFYRSNFERYRNLSIIGFGLIYMLNVFDASVDANLFDYDVSDKITMHIEPALLPRTNYAQGFGFKCRITF